MPRKSMNIGPITEGIWLAGLIAIVLQWGAYKNARRCIGFIRGR